MEDAHLTLLLSVGSFICVIGGGIAAGLTIGLMSLSKVDLEILATSGEEEEKEWAAKILPVRTKANNLLVTLLLANTVFNELLPLLVDDIPNTSRILAFVLPTLSVLVFGEIIPQAVCARYGLWIGAKCIWVVRSLQIVFFPIAWPISRLLDLALGEEAFEPYTRTELKSLIQLHSQRKYGALSDDETMILMGALDFAAKRVCDVMTPIQRVFMLEVHQVLDRDLLFKIAANGYSRIPVYDRTPDNIVCVLLMKNLCMHSVDKPVPLLEVIAEQHRWMKTASRKKSTSFAPLYFTPETKLDLALNEFQKGRSHLAIVRSNKGKNIGIVTLEDVIEELIQEEIYDESDQNPPPSALDLFILAHRPRPLRGVHRPPAVGTSSSLRPPPINSTARLPPRFKKPTKDGMKERLIPTPRSKSVDHLAAISSSGAQNERGGEISGGEGGRGGPSSDLLNHQTITSAHTMYDLKLKQGVSEDDLCSTKTEPTHAQDLHLDVSSSFNGPNNYAAWDGYAIFPSNQKILPPNREEALLPSPVVAQMHGEEDPLLPQTSKNGKCFCSSCQSGTSHSWTSAGQP